MRNGVLVKLGPLFVRYGLSHWSEVHFLLFFVLDRSLLVQYYDKVVKYQIIGLVSQFGGRSHKRIICSHVRA